MFWEIRRLCQVRLEVYFIYDRCVISDVRFELRINGFFQMADFSHPLKNTGVYWIEINPLILILFTKKLEDPGTFFDFGIPTQNWIYYESWIMKSPQKCELDPVSGVSRTAMHGQSALSVPTVCGKQPAEKNEAKSVHRTTMNVWKFRIGDKIQELCICPNLNLEPIETNINKQHPPPPIKESTPRSQINCLEKVRKHVVCTTCAVPELL